MNNADSHKAVKAVIFNLNGVLTDGNSALFGAVDFIHNTRKLGIKTACAASVDNITLLKILESAGFITMEMRSEQIGLAAAIKAAESNKVFDVLVNNLDVERKKPFPDIYLEAAQRLEEDPSNCWVIEHTPYGIQAAKAAGMRCLALLTTFPQEQLTAACPDKITKDLSVLEPAALFASLA